MSIETKPNQVAIDFASYRTPEIAETIGELVSFVGLFRSLVIVPLIVGLTGAAIVCWLLFTAENMTQAISVPPIVGVGTLVLATVGAIAETIRRCLVNMIRLVDLLLEATGRIAIDMRSVSSGERTLPGAARLTREVYAHVLLPLVEQSLTKSPGFLGRPIAWAYRRSLGRLVLFAIKLIPDRDDRPRSSTEIGKSLESIAGNEPAISSRLQWTRDKLTDVTSRIRFIMLVPYMSIALATIAITIWMSIWMWHLTAG